MTNNILKTLSMQKFCKTHLHHKSFWEQREFSLATAVVVLKRVGTSPTDLNSLSLEKSARHAGHKNDQLCKIIFKKKTVWLTCSECRVDLCWHLITALVFINKKLWSEKHSNILTKWTKVHAVWQTVVCLIWQPVLWWRKSKESRRLIIIITSTQVPWTPQLFQYLEVTESTI